MKTKLIAGVALSVVLLTQVGTDVSAEVRTIPGSAPGTEQRMENLQERRDQVLENIASRVELRFTRHEERLQNWIDRATKHVTTMEGNGKNMTNAKKALETAKTSLATATKLGDDAVVKLRAVTPENWSAQKTDAMAAREAVKKAQVAYAQVVKDMQQALRELKNAK
jgi:hypothetical protein